jgi:hypothetical protein
VSDGSRDISCAFITTPTWICRASVGFTGRISTAITRNIGKGTWRPLVLLRTSVRDREYRYYTPT